MTTEATDRVYNVLFLCTGNSARSILGEAIMNAVPGGKFRAFSAGSQPKGQVNPLTLHTLKELGLPTEGYRSKSWDEFATPDAPALDFVFTVCDDAAGETCPYWPGSPVQVHWGYPDPSNVGTTPDDKRAAFESTRQVIGERMHTLANVPFETLNDAQLRTLLETL